MESTLVKYPIHDLAEIGLIFDVSPLAQEAAMFVRDHCDEFIYNHTVRCAHWALILFKKVPEFAKQSIDISFVVIICILHDMGLASRKPDALPGLSQDKRFEVDGANIARNFVASHTTSANHWDATKLDRLWMAIALHTTPSIALHATPEIALANQAITADFAGPYWSSDGQNRPITMEEYYAITKAFPRGSFNREGLKSTFCGLCQQKTETTYDNFVGQFGREFGYDGEGSGREEYARRWEGNQVTVSLLRGLDALDCLDASGSG